MPTAEETYLKEAQAQGVDLPEMQENTEEKEGENAPKTTPEAPKTDESTVVPPEKDEKTEDDSTLTTEPKERPKRSIYDDLKEKKKEVKTERELREQAEKERDEIKIKFETLTTAKTPQEQQEALDDLEQFAEATQSDPVMLKQMRDLFLKDFKVQDANPELQKDLAEFKAWKSENQAVIEKSRFDTEFQQVTPTLKELLPNASDEEMQAVRAKVDEISHSAEFHDKELDYVIFRNKDLLSKLVSPKKRGMESKGKKDVQEMSTDFDPNADYASMTGAQRDAWETEYKKMSENKGLSTDARGRKIII